MAASGLIFNSDTGLYSPDTAEIREGVAGDWEAAFFEDDAPALDTDPSTPAGQLIDAEVAEIEAKNSEILFLSNQFNPKKAEGIWQDALAYIYFLERKLQEPSVVTCQLTGRYGTVIPYGALVQSVTGYTFICNRSITIGADGKAETTFRCSEAGPVDVAPDSVTSIVTTIAGWDTVDNHAAGAAGRLTETRAEFEERRAQSVAIKSHGSAGALLGTIGNISGVLDAAVLENITNIPKTEYGVEIPPHGVTICVFGGSDNDIAEAVYRKKDNGASTGGNTEITYTAADYYNAAYTYKILRPEPVNFWVKVILGAADDLTPSLISTIRQSIFNDFYGLNEASGNSRVRLASLVYSSRFFTAVTSINSVKNVKSITIYLGEAHETGAFTDLLTINGNQEPVISTGNISVTKQE